MRKKVTSKRVPVLVENDTYALCQRYSNGTGVSLAHVVNEALKDWMETVGAARLEYFKKTPSREILNNLLQMPAPKE